MAKIGGLWFLLLGIAMVSFSLFVQSKNNSAKMSLFILTGSVFIMIGTFKLVKGMILKDVNLPPQQLKKVQPIQQQKIPPQQNAPPMMQCPRCGSRNYASNPFCAYCRLKFK